MPDLHLTAPLTITRGDIELECEVRGIYVPYQRATLTDPEEGDSIEDIEVRAERVHISNATATFDALVELALSDSELQQAERALREAMKHHTDCED